MDTLKDHGVSAQIVNKLRKAGVLTVEQTLRCYPRKYQEFARFHAGMQAGTAVLVTGRVVSYLKAPYSPQGLGQDSQHAPDRVRRRRGEHGAVRAQTVGVRPKGDGGWSHARGTRRGARRAVHANRARTFNPRQGPARGGR